MSINPRTYAKALIGGAVGVQPFYILKAIPADPTTREVEALLASRRPVLLTVVGIVVLLIILWLMMYKPF